MQSTRRCNLRINRINRRIGRDIYCLFCGNGLWSWSFNRRSRVPTCNLVNEWSFTFVSSLEFPAFWMSQNSDKKRSSSVDLTCIYHLPLPGRELNFPNGHNIRYRCATTKPYHTLKPRAYGTQVLTSLRSSAELARGEEK